MTIRIKSRKIAVAAAGAALTALLVTLCGQMSARAAPVVVSSVHYQKRIILTCGDQSTDTSCDGLITAVASKRRLNITGINCGLFAPPGSAFSHGAIYLRNATGINHVAFQYLAGVQSASNGVHTLNQAVDMQVNATQFALLQLNVVSNGATNGLYGECNVTGTLDTLQ